MLITRAIVPSLITLSDLPYCDGLESSHGYRHRAEMCRRGPKRRSGSVNRVIDNTFGRDEMLNEASSSKV